MANAFGAEKVFKYVANGYDPERYRMHVDVLSEDRQSILTGLIDTGATTEVLSFSACRKLGIDHKIQKGLDSASGVDGKPLNVIGHIKTTIFVGDIEYNATFQVIDQISGFDVMIGTRFLNRKNVMEKIHRVVSDAVGKEFITRGN